MAQTNPAEAHAHPTLSEAARYVNIAAGITCFVVGLTPVPGVDFGKIMATAGLFIALFALLARKEPLARIGSAVAGATLFAAALVTRPATQAGTWLALGLGALVVGMALVPSPGRSPAHT